MSVIKPNLTEILTHHLSIARKNNSPLALDLERTIDALREKDEALVLIRQKGHLGNHNHWDDTMQHGRGCKLCIDQHIAFQALDKALTL